MDAPVRLLIVDDDRGLCDLLRESLASAGFDVDAVHAAGEGLARALAGQHAIAVLDVMLPDGSGFDVLRKIRASSALPVLMLTARGEDVDRIVGLESGADDYLAKPFNPRELVARLRAILRRAAAPRPGGTAGAVVIVDDVELDPASRLVRRGGQLVELTGMEFNMLEALLRCAGRVVPREELSRKVLGRELQPFDRSVDMHVSHLRKKLGLGAGGAERIRGIRGSGYIYVTMRTAWLAGEASQEG